MTAYKFKTGDRVYYKRSGGEYHKLNDCKGTFVEYDGPNVVRDGAGCYVNFQGFDRQAVFVSNIHLDVIKGDDDADCI